MNRPPPRFFPHQITITGQTAAGTTSFRKALLAELADERWRSVSAGDIMRDFAKEKGMSIEDFAAYVGAHAEEGYDRRIDDEIVKFCRSDYRIAEGRLVHHFAPHACRILLTCPSRVRAERRQRDPGYDHLSVEEVERLIVKRDEDDVDRYGKQYPGCIWPKEAFHRWYDTSLHAPEHMAKDLMLWHKSWLGALAPVMIIRSDSV